MRVDRLVSIIMILLDKERITARELSDTFEVSLRTIYRDIDSIDLAGIPVRSIAGVGGGFEIMPNYKIDKNVFSTTDLSAILMGLSNLSNMIKEEDLINALTKVRSFIPTDRAKDIEIKADQIHIDLSPWMGNRNIQSHLEVIKKALEKKNILAFEYTDRYGNKTKRTAEPYQLIMKGSHWYFQGYCYTRNDFRLFKLSRISNLQTKEEFFIPRDYKKPQLEFDDVLKTMQTDIKIRIHKTIMDRVLDYCSYENFSHYDDDYLDVNFPFIENEYYYNILFSFGSKCECLEPAHIRAEIKRRIQDIAVIYTK